MGYPNHNDFKTEHNGAKKGKGAYYGRKQEAKAYSNKARRQVDRLIAEGRYDEAEECHDA